MNIIIDRNTLWEENVLIGALKKYGVNGDNDGNVITTNMVIRSNNLNDNDTSDEKIVRKKRSQRVRDRRKSIKRKGRYFFMLAKKLRKLGSRKGKRYFVTAQHLWGIAKRQQMRCALTNRKLTKNNLSVDHIIPLSKGGTNQLVKSS